MRSSNGYVWSEWSASEVVPLDQDCLSTNTSSLEDERGSSMEDECGLNNVISKWLGWHISKIMDTVYNLTC